MTKKIGEVHKPAPTPLTLPDPGETKMSMEKSEFVLDGLDMNARIRTGLDTCFGTLSRTRPSLPTRWWYLMRSPCHLTPRQILPSCVYMLIYLRPPRRTQRRLCRTQNVRNGLRRTHHVNQRRHCRGSPPFAALPIPAGQSRPILETYDGAHLVGTQYDPPQPVSQVRMSRRPRALVGMSGGGR